MQYQAKLSTKTWQLPAARLAQSVERETLNLKVVGSTPTSGSIPDVEQHLLFFAFFSFSCLAPASLANVRAFDYQGRQSLGVSYLFFLLRRNRECLSLVLPSLSCRVISVKRKFTFVSHLNWRDISQVVCFIGLPKDVRILYSCCATGTQAWKSC